MVTQPRHLWDKRPKSFVIDSGCVKVWQACIAPVIVDCPAAIEEVAVTSPIERRLADLGLQLPDAGGAGRQLRALHDLRQAGVRLRSTADARWAGRGDRPPRRRRQPRALGEEAARLCALNLLAQAKAACNGDLGRLARCLKLGGFVSCTSDFVDHPKVINGASDLIATVMGDGGIHARFAVGCASLPLNAAVEVEAIFALG